MTAGAARALPAPLCRDSRRSCDAAVLHRRGDTTAHRDRGRGSGEADDEVGVQALVVEIGGTTARGDGSHFHITWSLAPGRAAKESNDVIGQRGWRAIDPALPIRLTPVRWKS